MSLSDSLRDAIVDRIAAQWIALGCRLAGSADATVVDLEALLVVTAEVAESDPRVYEAALDWCLAYGQAVNTSRLKRVAAEIGGRSPGMSEFAGTLTLAGGPRWPFAARGRPYAARGKVAVSDLLPAGRLVWRVRAAFGVNARADIIAALLVMPAPSASIADLARRTRFTKRNVAQAVGSMRLAGVVEADRVGNEDRVGIRADSPLRSWLYPEPAAPFIDWPARWRIALQALVALEATASASPTVRAVEGRAWIEGVIPALNDAALPRPNLAAMGSAFADAYDAWIAVMESTLRSPQR